MIVNLSEALFKSAYQTVKIAVYLVITIIKLPFSILPSKNRRY